MNIFVKRIDCWNDTKRYTFPVPPSVKLEYTNEPFIKKYKLSNIYFVDEDSIECGWRFENCLVLNLADDIFAGGCVNQGSGAQEESLFRRTNLFETLKQNMYPIKDNEAIYSPAVTVFKDTEANDWRLYPEPKKLCFIACPGLKYPQNIVDHRLQDSDIERLKIKIKLIIQVAQKYNHDTIIFGAMGCGAWRNPIRHVAEIFKEVLQECDGVIKNYVFAILTTNENTYIIRDHGRATKTIDIFKSVFFN